MNTTRLALAGCLLFAASNGYAGQSNPYVERAQFVNPEHSTRISETAERHADLKARILRVKDIPAAVWLDNIAATGARLDGALRDARIQEQQSGREVVLTFVVYNLPERDCAARASNGELLAHENGLERYKHEYIDTIIRKLRDYPELNYSIILEPDSLPNLITNLDTHAKCRNAEPTYREGTYYAIDRLYEAGATIYVDGGGSGWLGWVSNRQKASAFYKSLLAPEGRLEKIRGFAFNTANYTPLMPGNHPDDYYQYNPARSELLYVDQMTTEFVNAGLPTNFVIDTSRNGNPNARQVWGNWCNIKDAALGVEPTIHPYPHVDAYLWVKTPGESDGTSDQNAARFDSMCHSIDSVQNAPEAGQWFEEYFLMLVRNSSY